MAIVMSLIPSSLLSLLFFHLTHSSNLRMSHSQKEIESSKSTRTTAAVGSSATAACSIGSGALLSLHPSIHPYEHHHYYYYYYQSWENALQNVTRYNALPLPFRNGNGNEKRNFCS